MEFYWLHCLGPDGPCVLFATYSTRTQTYDLIDDGRSERIEEIDGRPMLHKWELVRRERIERPSFSRETA